MIESWLLAAALALLGVLLLRVATEMRQLRRLLMNHIEAAHIGVSIDGDDDDGADGMAWPAGVLEVNAPVPPEIERVGRGTWTLLVVLRQGCSNCKLILDELPATVRSLVDYRVVIVNLGAMITSGAPDSVPQVELRATQRDAVPAPSMLMVDPDGIIQGRGALSSAVDLLVFASEGQEHGFGPRPEPGAAQPRVS